MWVDVEEELGCTSRTLRRWIGQHQAWFNHRPDFKAQVLYWKLSSAALLLSSPENKVREVALATGYGTDRALLRAMQDHGLPPPRDIRSAFSLK
jgi:transcriptional regulator GlxA family with amidase domain